MLATRSDAEPFREPVDLAEFPVRVLGKFPHFLCVVYIYFYFFLGLF